MGASGATPHPASQLSRATDDTASASPSLAPSAPRLAAFAPPNDAGTVRAAKAALLIAAATAPTDSDYDDANDTHAIRHVNDPALARPTPERWPPTSIAVRQPRAVTADTTTHRKRHDPTTPYPPLTSGPPRTDGGLSVYPASDHANGTPSMSVPPPPPPPPSSSSALSRDAHRTRQGGQSLIRSDADRARRGFKSTTAGVPPLDKQAQRPVSTPPQGGLRYNPAAEDAKGIPSTTLLHDKGYRSSSGLRSASLGTVGASSAGGVGRPRSSAPATRSSTHTRSSKRPHPLGEFAAFDRH